jgi:hypothetical protein
MGGTNEDGQCSTCNGHGGWWEHGNGQRDIAKPKHWIKCYDCDGKGKK